MRIVIAEDTTVELRWSWLPYWLAASPAMKRDVERVVNDAMILNGLEVSEENLDKINAFVIRTIQKRFPIKGLGEYLTALEKVVDPSSAYV